MEKDVGKQEKAKVDLELSKKEMKRLIDRADCAMFTIAPGTDIRVFFANKKFFKVIQYTPEEFQEKFNNRVMELVVVEERQRIRSLIARQTAMGGALHLEYRIRKKDGMSAWIALTAEPARIEGELLYYCSATDITNQKRSLEEIYNAKREVDLIANSILGGVIKLRTKDFSLLYANDGFFSLAGYSRAEYFSEFGNICKEVIHPDDRMLVQKLLQSAIDNQGYIGLEYRIINKAGEIRWSYANGRRIDDVEGSPVFLCIITDITNRKRLELRLEDYIRASRVLHTSKKRVGWAYDIENGYVIRNGYLEGSYSPESEIPGGLTEEFLSKIAHPEDVMRLRRAIQERIDRVGQSSAVYLVKDNMGNYRPTQMDMISVCVEDLEGKPDRIYGETRALSEQEDRTLTAAQTERDSKLQKQENRILSLAENALAVQEDVVTELMSYQDFLKRMAAVLQSSDKEEKYGVLCCDINDFSKINYHYGISIGNTLLRGLGGILKERFAYKEICTRIRGDYFVVFFSYDSYNALLKLLSATQKEIAARVEKLNYITYGTTTGVFLIENIKEDVVEMISRADLARRSIKGTKGNRFAIYSEDLQRDQFKEEEIIHDIDDAISNHTVEICYLPRIRNDKDHVMGCKVVPQVQTRHGEYLSLEDLKRYMDRTQEVQQLVFYVLANVCRTQGTWKAQGKKILPISLDVTQGQLCTKDAVERIDRIVRENGMDPYEILFEIQEQYFREMTPKFQMALEDLHKKGYRIIISRFGSDHTSVHSLRHLPIHAIKFHGEFFHENITDEKEIKIFTKIVALAHELGMETSCGGIHTELQEKMARSIGCDIFEGDMYYGMVRNDVYARCFLSK
ncbi:MAG: EAL domain-containing protein [Lachnospiraceae bacterium]|nr:EAL domain-containing protein [Lachnospiraceae bacterium]